jgi:hypothetical protein
MDNLNGHRYYRCYFIQDDRIVDHEDLYSRDDDGAIEKARELLNAERFV